MVSTHALARPGSSAPLGIYLRRLWKLRHFAWAHARSSVRASTSSSLLGDLWLLLEPAMLIAIYFVVFGIIMKVDRGTENFLAFLTVGQIVFTHTRRGVLESGGALLSRGPMLRTFAFPRAILPVSAVLRTFMTHVVASVAMFIAVLGTGESPRLTWIIVPFLAVAQALLNLGVGLFLARFMVTTDDLRRLLQYAFRLGLYGSGVIFNVRAYVEPFEHGDLWLKLFAINPVYVFIELHRWAILDMEPAFSGLVIFSAVLWTFGSLVLGLWWFRRGESRYTGFGKVVLR